MSEQHRPSVRPQVAVRLAALVVVLAALASALGAKPPRSASGELRIARSGASRDLLCQLDAALDEPPPGRTGRLLPACACDSSPTSSCRVVDTGDDRRRALVLRTEAELEVPLDVRGARSLRFTAATRGLGDTLDVRIALSTGGEPRVWERRLTNLEGWVDGSLEIDAHAEKATLRISVSAPAAGDRNAFLALAAPRLVEPAVEPRPPGPRNILVYLIDTLRADHTSAYGYARPTTPRLQELAEDGVLFERAYSTAARTRPAVASLLTSLYPSRHQARLGRGLSLDTETLAERLREAGWSTWAFVANGHVFGRTLNFEQGFDLFRAVRGAKLNNHARSEEIYAPLLPYLRAHADEPFFLFVHAVDPHSPYDPPPGYLGTFGDPAYSGTIEPQQTRSRVLERMEIAPDDLARVRDLYDEDIRYQDAMLGVLLDELAQLALLDDTLIVVVADHGEEFLEHGRWEHGDRLYEEMLRVPLVLRVPGIRQLEGLRVSAPVSLVDVVPTLLRWYGLDAPADAQGSDVSPLLFGEQANARPPIFSEEATATAAGDLSAIVDGPWKLIRRAPLESSAESDATYELFHLAEDPGERNNRAAKNPAILATLRTRLAARRAEVARDARAPAPREQLDPRTRQQLEALGYVVD